MNESTALMNSTMDVGECAISLIEQYYVKYPLIIIYLLVFVVCLVGNLLTLLVICTHPHMQTVTNYFLGNLVVADLLVAVFCIIQNMVHIIGFVHAHWPFGELVCRSYLGMLQIVPCISVGILVCVSVEKYIAVMHPLTALKILTKRLRYIVTGCIWIGSFITNSPFFYYARTISFVDENHETFTACIRTPLPYWTTVIFFVWYLTPVIILAIIYLRIGRLLWVTGSNQTSTRQSSDSQGSIGNSWQMANGRVVVYKQESLLQVPDKDKNQDAKRPKDTEGRRKVVRLLFAVVLSFALLTFPHHSRLIYSSWTTSQLCFSSWTTLIQPFSYICLFVSSAMNPILYACLSKRFRNAVVDVLKCRKGVFSRISRSRNRTLVSDVPLDESRCPSPNPVIRMHRLR